MCKSSISSKVKNIKYYEDENAIKKNVYTLFLCQLSLFFFGFILNAPVIMRNKIIYEKETKES